MANWTQEIRDANCQKCKLHQGAEFVCLLGEGPKSTDVMIIGEAPGEREDSSGRPFVGKSGQLLMEILEDHDFTRKEVYITNAVSCRPPDNRTPKKNEISACRYWMFKQMAKVKPKFVLLLGNVPCQSVLDLKGIKSLRGKPIERDGIVYLPTYHPAYILRDPASREIFEADIRLFREIVDNQGIPKEEGLNIEVVDSPRQFQRMLAALKGKVAVDIETTGLYPWAPGAKINALGFGTKGAQWIFLLQHPGTGLTNEMVEKRMGRSIQKMVEDIDDVLQDCEIIGQNFKFDALWCRVHFDVEWYAHFDTMLAHYMLDENSFHSLKYLSTVYYGAIDYDIPEKEKTGHGTDLNKFVEYQAKDLYYTRKLRFTLGKQLRKDEDVAQVFWKIMMPCSHAFTRIEYRGVYVDVKRMGEVEEKLRLDLAAAEKKMKKYGDINWNSTQQLASLLFEDLEIDVIEKTKGGAPSTSESVLKRIDHPIAEAILAHRAAGKQLSAFIEGWKPYIIDGRLHPTFKLHGTVTGRLSCANPNLQQVPRDPVIRSLLTAPAGWVLLDIDLSQIELRIAAELAGERNMLKAFANNIDVHWLTAMREIARGGGMAETVLTTARKISGKKLNYKDSIELLLKVGPDAAQAVNKDWKELRKKAKAINFGYLFGMWWKKFKIYARDNYGVDVTDEQAQESRKAYFELYPDLKDWHDKQRRYARQNGYVSSLSGRKRRLPGAQIEHDCPERGEAERQAINTPVQSFANELNLMALLQVDKEFKEDIVRPVGTVHDAILIEIREDHVERVVKRILKIMQHPALLDEFGIKLQVPVEAEASVGPWGKGIKVEQWLKQNSK